jgi:hypothetical protein
MSEDLLEVCRCPARERRKAAHARGYTVTYRHPDFDDVAAAIPVPFYCPECGGVEMVSGLAMGGGKGVEVVRDPTPEELRRLSSNPKVREVLRCSSDLEEPEQETPQLGLRLVKPDEPEGS